MSLSSLALSRRFLFLSAAPPCPSSAALPCRPSSGGVIVALPHAPRDPRASAGLADCTTACVFAPPGLGADAPRRADKGIASAVPLMWASGGRESPSKGGAFLVAAPWLLPLLSPNQAGRHVSALDLTMCLRISARRQRMKPPRNMWRSCCCLSVILQLSRDTCNMSPRDAPCCRSHAEEEARKQEKKRARINREARTQKQKRERISHQLGCTHVNPHYTLH